MSFERCRTAYFSDTFNAEVMPATKLRAREVIEARTLEGGKEYRKVRMVPDVHLPGPVARLLDGALISYNEITIYDPSTQTADLHIESPAGPTVQVKGKVHFGTVNSDVVTRFSGEVHVKVFALGKLIEKFIVSEVTRRYAKVEELLQAYLDAGRDRA